MRIVFASLGSLGDLFPMLALATASRERGHSVVLAAAQTYEQRVKDLGIEFVPIRPDFTTDVLRDLFSDPKHGTDKTMSHLIFPESRHTYEDLLGAAQGADFLVSGELVYVARTVAEKLGIPWANAMLSPISIFSTSDPSMMSAAPGMYKLRHLGRWTHRVVYALGRRKTSVWAAPLNVLRKELGLDSLNPIFDGKFSPVLGLAMWPSFFAKPQVDWPKGIVQPGFPYFVQPPQPEVTKVIEDFVAAGEAPIVFTLGSTAVYMAKDFYQIATDVIQQMGKRAILLIGKNTPPEAPADRILSLPFAPLDQAVIGSAAVVHHGGIGSCAEVLRVGVPALIIPFGADQPDNAIRLKRLGTALSLDHNNITRESLKAKLTTLLADSAMKARAKEYAKQINATATLTKAVEAMERVAAGGVA